MEIARIAELERRPGTEEASAATQEQTASMQEMYTSAAPARAHLRHAQGFVSIFKM